MLWMRGHVRQKFYFKSKSLENYDSIPLIRVENLHFCPQVSTMPCHDASQHTLNSGSFKLLRFGLLLWPHHGWGLVLYSVQWLTRPGGLPIAPKLGCLL
jgi:hypothetical protein